MHLGNPLTKIKSMNAIFLILNVGHILSDF